MFSRSKKAMDSSPAHVRPRPPDAPPTEKLPQGAEAALWAILEVIPDPRNHLALTRDPTCEVRLTPAQLAEALATAPVPVPAPIPAPASAADAPTADGAAAQTPAPNRTRQQARRADVRWSTDTAEVRLPVIASPDNPNGDASVHTLDPPAAADPAPWAKGA